MNSTVHSNSYIQYPVRLHLDVNNNEEIYPVGGLVQLHVGVGDCLDLRAAAVSLRVEDVTMPGQHTRSKSGSLQQREATVEHTIHKLMSTYSLAVMLNAAASKLVISARAVRKQSLLNLNRISLM